MAMYGGGGGGGGGGAAGGMGMAPAPVRDPMAADSPGLLVQQRFLNVRACSVWTYQRLLNNTPPQPPPNSPPHAVPAHV